MAGAGAGLGKQAQLRLPKELGKLRAEPPPGVAVWARGERLDRLEGQLVGPEGTPYAGGVFRLEVAVPARYPFEPPKVRFVTPVYHPNIDSAGRICLDTLNMPPKGCWTPSLNLSTVMTSVRLLLAEPNPDDGLMVDITREFRVNHPLFLQKARQQTREHAMGGEAGGGPGAEAGAEAGGEASGAKRKATAEPEGPGPLRPVSGNEAAPAPAPAEQPQKKPSAFKRRLQLRKGGGG